MQDARERSAQGPSWLWYIFGAALLCALPAIFVVSIMLAVGKIDGQTITFDAPGAITITVEEPATYTIWNEIFTNASGGVIKESIILPDNVAITVTDPAGQQLEVNHDTGAHIETGGTKRISLANVQILTSGEHTFDVRGDADQTFLAAISPAVAPVLFDTMRASAPFIIASMLAFGVGIAILGVTFVRRFRANERRKEAEYAEIAAGF